MADTKIQDGLNQLLADATVFYQRLRNFHWMVSGPQFFQLHEKFEELYRAWADHGDEIAERIVALGGKPVRTLAAVLHAASLNESDAELSAESMLETIIEDMDALSASVHKLVGEAEQAGDRTTVTLLDDLRANLDKEGWMLRSARGSTIPY